jgi:hypothetical protein
MAGLVALAVLVAIGQTPALLAQEHVSHIHIGDRLLNNIFQRGLQGSATFRSVVDRLDAASIQVFVGCDAMMPDSLSGRLMFLSNVYGVRYVRIGLRCALSPRQQLSFLAHELQHAVEIGDNTDVTDLDGMESYYADNGFRTHASNTYRSFETDAALAVQRLVDQEMNEDHNKD